MKKIGVTGGIGSGKSIVCSIFQLLGIPVFNADESAKRLMANDPSLRELLKEKFGSETYTSHGELNRKWLGEKVFNNNNLLQELNSMVHPAVGKDFQNWCDSLPEVPYCIREAAIIFESETGKDLDKIILVDAPQELRIERVIKRDARTHEQVKAIVSRQWLSEKKRKLADFIVENNDQQMVIPQVLKIHNLLTENGE